MTTQEYLSKYGVTLKEARDFVMNNLDHLDVVYNTAKEFGVNNDMLADIVSSDFPGVTGKTVNNFFNQHGFDGISLGFNSSGTYHHFTVNELAGKIFYDVDTDSSNGSCYVEKQTFNFMDTSHGTATMSGGETIAFNYSIDSNGVLVLNASDGTTSYVKAFDDSKTGGLELKWVDTGDGLSYEDLMQYPKDLVSDIDFFFSDENQADTFMAQADNLLSTYGDSLCGGDMSIDNIL